MKNTYVIKQSIKLQSGISLIYYYCGQDQLGAKMTPYMEQAERITRKDEATRIAKGLKSGVADVIKLY